MNRQKNDIPNEPHDGTFLSMIQAHEREWGTDTYTGKPSLADMLSAKVVAFWQKASGDDPREFVTLHDDTTGIETHLAKLVLRSGLQTPDRRLVAVFEAQKRLKVKAFRVVFTSDDV